VLVNERKQLHTMNRGNSPPDQPPDALNFLVESPTFNDVPDANFMWPNGIGSMPVVSASGTSSSNNNGHNASSDQARAPASASATSAYNQFSLDDAASSALQQQQQQQANNNTNTAGYLPMNYSLPQHLTMQYAGTVAGVGLPPSVVSTADSSYASSATGSKRGSKQHMGGTANLKSAAQSMQPEEKRRYDRNLREQQRSYKISQQIKNLRNVLQESNIPFKPNKYSILLSVVEYIKELQTRAVYLDQEHQKLLNTISQTNELVNNSGGVDLNSGDGATIGNDSELLFVKGLDYKAIFQQCSSALCIAALDGRMLECNTQFEEVSGYDRDELLNQTVFNLLSSPGMEELFEELSKFLKQEEPTKSPTSSPTSTQQQKQQESEDVSTTLTGASGNCDENSQLKAFWSGQVHRKRKQDKISTDEAEPKCKSDEDDLFMNITLAKSKDGRPQFLNCALTAK